MRDLMRNYKMIIKGKHQDSDTETEPLMTSSSSSPQSFGTIREPRIFKQESYSTESEDEVTRKPEKASSKQISPFSIQKHAKRQLLFPSTFTPPDVDPFMSRENTSIYDRPYHKITRVYSQEPDLLPIQKTITKNRSYGSFHGYKNEDEKPSQNSLVTIFSIWNTTMGSSLLAMSWGLEKTGLFPGIIINIAIAALCLYTAYLLLNVNERHGMLGQNIEVPDLCRMLIGKWAEILAKIFSIVVLLGANIVYWILMSNFLYNSVVFLYVFLNNKEDAPEISSVVCLKAIHLNINETNILEEKLNSTHPALDKIWDLYSTVPVFLAIVMFPLLNFKSPTFFTKFNSLGTLSVGYLILFVAIKSFSWGVNIPNWSAELYLKPTFCALSGMLSLSYFIHNIIISIMRNNKHQEHNGRDLTIAFALITFTYIFLGVAFYVSFPMAKTCIEDNILNNFSKRDILTIIARLLLLFQLLTVFPLISFMLRNDVLINMNMIFKNYRFGDFSYGKVIVINCVVLFICIMFACFLPRIGTLIRYTGALSGLVYIFMLPNLLKISSLKKERRLTTVRRIFHISVIIIGVLNLFSQFFISDK